MHTPTRDQMPSIVIQPTDNGAAERANTLSRSTGLPVMSPGADDWVLRVSESQLSLIRSDGVPLTIDFTSGKAIHRTREADFRKQPLARALGLKSTHRPSVIDATAGLGADAWMMACLGCHVTMLEQSSVLSALLQHAIDTALEDEQWRVPAERLSLLNTDAIKHLNQANTLGTNVVYLDPMYPVTNKSALVKKGMQFLQTLVGPALNNEDLLNAALAKATQRVVVKRPKGAATLADISAKRIQLTHIESPNTRFDIYHV